MNPTKPLQDCAQKLFEPFGKIRIRKMFSGAAVYSGQDLFALLDDRRIYLKVDEPLKCELETSGGKPFVWTNPDTGRVMTMSYVSLPKSARDDYVGIREWGRMALGVAQAARRAKVKSPRRGPF